MSHPILLLTFASAAAAAASPHERSLDVKSAPRAYASEAEVEAPAARPTAPARSLGANATALGAAGGRVRFDVDPEGTVWARGRTYKASFSRDSAAYVPFLGSQAPRNFPLDLRVESVTIGGEPIAFDAAVPATRSGDVVEYARGPFVERYLFTSDSVEQTFVFEDLPRRGEIVITLAFASELARGADAEGFTFSNALGHVRYGSAFAYHDDLPKTPIASRICDERIEITAPAAAVDGARGPFVVDPVLTTYSVETAPIDEFAADTSYDLTNAIWLTVTEETYSATDHDVHVRRHSTTGAFTASEYVDFTGDDWRSPAVANNNLDDQFLVVAVEGVAPNRQIWGRTVEATASLNMSVQFEIGGDLGGDKSAPDVGGDPVASAPAYYAVVWERVFSADIDHDVHARLVATDATLLGAGTISIDNTANTLHRNPAISNSNGTGATAEQNWNIVWEDYATPTNRNILGARLRWDGALTESTFTVASSTLDERNPSASPIVDDGAAVRPWMVAWEIETASNGWDVRCRTFDGAGSIATFDLSEQFATVGLDQTQPTCDTDGAQFVVANQENPGPLFTATDIKVSTLYSLGGALGVNEGNVSVAPGIEVDLRPRIVCQASSGSALDDALIVFDRDAGGPNDVYATAYDLPAGGPVASYCSGDGSGTACPCGNAGAVGNGCASSVNAAGANLAASGAADLSADSLELTASGLPASTSVLFFQGTTQSSGGAGALFGDGLRCASGTVVRLATKNASAGVAIYPTGAELDVSVRGSVPAAGAVRYYQGWYRNAAPFCTASTFNLTNGLRVQWIP